MVLDVGPDRFVDPYQIVTLSAPNVTSWQQTAGSPTVALGGSGAAQSFTAPPTQTGATLTFQATTSSNATIPDGTFETGTTGWYPYNSTGVQDSTHAHDGTYALKVSPTGTYGDVGCTVTGVQPSANYTVTAWFYVEATPGRALSIYATCTDAASTKTTTSSPSFTPPVGTWQQQTYTFTSTADVASLRIGVTLSGSTVPMTTVWIDDVTITGPGNTAETDELLVHVYPWHEWQRTASGSWSPAQIHRK